jgi:predicted MFS family arabinose efflux permease
LATFLTLLLPYILSQFFRAFLAVVAGDLGRDLALGPADLGSLAAAWFWAFAAAQLPLGYALDHAGPRRTLALTMIPAVAGAALLAMAGGKLAALIAMALIGLGCSPILMAGYYILARLYPVRQFALVSSLLLGFGSLGDPLSATPLTLAIAAFGWRGTMLAIAAVTAASVVLVWFVLRDPPPPPRGGPRMPFVAGILRIAGIRALWPMLPLVLVGYGVVIAIRGLWIAPFLETVHGFDAVARGHVALAMGLAVGLGAVAYGPAERWIGSPKPTVLAGSLIAGSVLLVLATAGNRSAMVAILSLAALGFFGLTYGILMVHARAFIPAQLLGRGVTFLNLVFMAGAGLVQSASGRFVQWAGTQGLTAEATYGRLHFAFAVLLLAAAAIYAATPRAPAAGPA